MRYLTSWLVALAWALTATAGQAQEKYTIKLKEIGKGESLRVEFKDKHTLTVTTTLDKDKKPKVEEHKASKHLLFTETILEGPDTAQMPTQVKRVYQIAELKGSGGPGAFQDRAPPYHGKTVFIEKKGKGYEFRLEGGEVLQKDIEELNAEFNGNGPQKPKKALVPPGPVAQGQTWKFDPKDLVSDPAKEDGTEILKSEATGKLVKVYKKDGRTYGVIEATLELHLNLKLMPKDTKLKQVLVVEIKGTMKLTFDGCIDGTFAEGKLIGTANMNSATTQRVEEFGAVTTISRDSNTADYSWKELAPK